MTVIISGSFILRIVNYKTVIIVAILLMCSAGLHASELADKTVSWLNSMGLNPFLIVFIISMLPIIELRGAIPVAVLLFQIPWPQAVLVSVIGNMVPIPLLLLGLEGFFALISKIPVGHRITQWLFARTRRKGKAIEKYEAIGLVTFVGIPLPGTGGWTGSLAARIFGITYWKSLLYIFFGVLIAAAIVTPLTLLGLLAVN
ncbi:MAG: small multi-drug export protein [Candidatus Cloacimonetes bacterium]|nr:small multi-drug export protein [Candidatus Cloacimonadota bacterium]